MNTWTLATRLKHGVSINVIPAVIPMVVPLYRVIIESPLMEADRVALRVGIERDGSLFVGTDREDEYVPLRDLRIALAVLQPFEVELAMRIATAEVPKQRKSQPVEVS